MSSPRWIRWAAPAAIVGGLLWALFPLGTVFVDLDEKQLGTLAYLATAALYWLMAVVPLLLLLVGLAAMHAMSKTSYGRLGNAGFLVSFAALSLMFVGNAIEVASLTFSGSKSAVGHSAFLIGFLLLLIGSALLGIVLVRTRREPVSRAGGLVLVAALPLGILLAVVLGAIAPGTDLGFWAAITVPYGVAWVLLGRALGSKPAGQPARVA
jgi:hypothetical protein